MGVHDRAEDPPVAERGRAGDRPEDLAGTLPIPGVHRFERGQHGCRVAPDRVTGIQLRQRIVTSVQYEPVRQMDLRLGVRIVLGEVLGVRLE